MHLDGYEYMGSASPQYANEFRRHSPGACRIYRKHEWAERERRSTFMAEGMLWHCAGTGPGACLTETKSVTSGSKQLRADGEKSKGKQQKAKILHDNYTYR